MFANNKPQTPHPFDKRDERGKAIYRLKDQITQVDEYSFRVKSQTGNGVYEVKLTDNGTTCTCPDYSKGHICKHILAVRYRMGVEVDLDFKKPVVKEVRPTYPQIWSAYNAAQTEEIRLFNTLLGSLVETVPEPEQSGRGRPSLPIQESLFCAIQKVYSQLSSRRAYSLFKNATERGYIAHAPHFNAPSKLFNDPETTPILHRLVTLSSLPVAELETDFAVDSTGFRTTTFSAYHGMKHGIRRENRWLKAHFSTGIKTHIITSVRITDENGGDSPQFEPLVIATSENFTIREVSADLAYSSRDNLRAVNRLGGTAYIPFKNNTTGRSHGSFLWVKMYHYFQLNRDEFMDHYHKRSNIESTNAAIKRKFGETIRSKNRHAQVNELLAKVIAYNLTVVIHEMYENGIKPEFVNQALQATS